MRNISSSPIYEDCIELTLPTNSAYVSAARLTASSIANRMGFNIEDIEDIKAAVSEACTYLIRQNSYCTSKTFKIQFKLINKTLEINLISEKPLLNKYIYEDNTFGILMGETLMDKIFFSTDESSKLNISMTKLLTN